ncbi:MAG: tRNA dihydrouridine synthase DusB [Bacteroidales bacterium]|nr:tRNA dihydrouridine synthase DusB [Bacteroidales bacterium]
MFSIGNISFTDTPIILAPMEDITDPSFRSVCKELGADLMYTEFIASEGLIRDAAKSLLKLKISTRERPIGIQIFGHNIDSMIAAAEIAEQAKPDLIDLNFGCPVKKVVRKGGGAGMLKDIPKMVSMTEAVVRATGLPVTVKTRLGWDEQHKNIVDIAEQLQDTGIKAITIHGRTKVQLYKGKADWTLIGAVKNNPRMNIPVIGNGDIDSPGKALEMKNRYGVDGLMIGRAALGNPWLFKRIKYYLKTGNSLPLPAIQERVRVCRVHLQRAIQLKGERRAVIEMRKYYSNYFKGLPDFKQYKMRLMTMTEFDEVDGLLGEIAYR